jgi:hypothetical protein
VGYEVVEAQTFWDCVMSLRRDDRYQAQLMEALIELRQEPFGNPRLQTHDVGQAPNGKSIFSSDVGGRRSDRRLIWQIFNRTIVVLLYGTHAVQARAQRMRVGFDSIDRVVTVYEAAQDSGDERPYQIQRTEIGRLYMAWTDAELQIFGFTEPVMAQLRVLDTEDQLLALEKALDPAVFELAFNLHVYGDPRGKRDVIAAVGAEAEEPAPTDEDREIEKQLEDARSGAWFTRTEPEFLREVLSRPIEDWMIFLHPDQRVIVRRNFEGPARVRGSAGTGKTVVGLHRAAWLAQQNRERGVARPLLFTTFIKSLPPVFESLFLRLPGTRGGEVEFVHIDRLAARVCASAGDRVVTAPREIDAAFATATKRVVTTGSPLDVAGFTRQYLRDEIAAVIKGRGITSVDTYLEVSRTGRRAPMGRVQRAQLWDLMIEWDTEMSKRGTVDFVDAVARARDHARVLTEPRYSGAVIDEAQDLSLVGLQFVRALVNAPDSTNRPNGLLLLGDGAQRIYAGGFKLRQAGVEVRGRTAVLRINYRNTGEIIETAAAVAGDCEVDDLGEEFRRGDADRETDRHGSKPLLIDGGDFSSQLDVVVNRVTGLVQAGEVGTGDIGILVPTNKLVDATVAHLRRAGLGVQELDKYEGRPNELIKVGTYHRGKGLEFKVVFLPGLTRGAFPRSTEGNSPDEAAEARDLAISQLFVAMTRARDLLVVLYDGEPSDVLESHLDRFELAAT